MIKVGSILKRRGNQFKVISIDDLFTKLIRVDDVELRQKNKQEMLNNNIFKCFCKCVQDNIIASYDKPGFFYVENTKIKRFFTEF